MATLIAGVRASVPPSGDPFKAVAAVLYQILYPPFSIIYMRSIEALHVIMAIQLVIFLAALFVRWRRHKTDMWLFRVTSTSRGSYITPHFAVAWQVCSVLSLVVLQPFLVMVRDNATGHDWPGYLGARSMIYLPIWLSTWLALWSLTVAVCIPLSKWNGSGRLRFVSTPRFVNAHFIAGIVLACGSIISTSVIYSLHYDAGIAHYEEAMRMLVKSSLERPSMSSAEVDRAFGAITHVVQEMLASLARFPHLFKIAWAVWVGWIVYSYSIFIVVSLLYFSYIKRQMRRTEGLSNNSVERPALNRALSFSALSCLLITILGVVYLGLSLFAAVWTDLALNSPAGLEAEFLVSLYCIGLIGLAAGALSLAQALLSSAASTSSSSQGASIIKSPLSRISTQIHVEVHKRTVVDHASELEGDVVQLELSDWQRYRYNEGEKPQRGGESL